MPSLRALVAGSHRIERPKASHTPWDHPHGALYTRGEFLLPDKQDMLGRRLPKLQLYTHSHPFNGKRCDLR
ncbi:hypothetical protein PSCICM_29030 [Pseudomonas cichorii]|nr:hypothetical protein PSCICM_29030 [Pseudomonas cichorii]